MSIIITDARKILFLTIITSVLFVFFDTIIDPHFHKSLFFEQLIIADGGHEFFMRFTVVVLLIATGFIAAGLLRKKQKAELEKERVIAELQEAIKRIETLSGLLPICAYCKKVRDDQGYWNRIETYVTKHSRAEFTHSICPECEKKAIDDFNRTLRQRDAN
ncbi:MAG: hypothetical protein A3J24_07665 [Deltaproteobacteria bacterium RIFCSPLOWO2_02_FULL_53_8]|nr:MAG: hypothetical protein A3J24_07665 [Deltaproteobacteria bacterium RIFCSPLOWO2_02_FULL_53_8]